MVVHDLTNDISYNDKLNWSKICYFGVKYTEQKKKGILNLVLNYAFFI